MTMKEKQALLKTDTLSEIPKSQREEVLSALESFVGPEIPARTNGLKQLLEVNAHRRSALVAAIMARQIDEPDIHLRSRIVEAIAAVLKPGAEEAKPPEVVRLWLRHVLGQMRQREIFAVLQVIATSPEQIDAVCDVLNACSFSGEALVRILANRKVDINIRIAAAKAIGKIGFLDAGPDLRRIQERLMSRKAGQMEMAFAPLPDVEAENLLPVVSEALQLLEGGID
jgi:HEAT repeat protein